MNANVVPLPEGGPIKPEVRRCQNDGTSRVRDSSTQDVDSMLPSLSSSKLPFQSYIEIASRPVDVGRPLMRARSPSVDDPDLFRVSTPTHTPSPSLASCTSDDEGSTTSCGTTMDRYTWMNERIYPNAEMFGRTWRPVDLQFQKICIMEYAVELIELGSVHVAPVRDPRKMLEIGTGTGCWGHNFAVTYPNTDVIGTDTACPQRETQWPRHGPTQLNFHLEIHDWNKKWNRKHCDFDLIFARMVDGLVENWSKLAAEIYACLKPGAWFEGRERSFSFSDARGRPLRRGSAWSYITNEIQRLGSWTGYSFNITESGNYATCLKGAGFVNIRVFQQRCQVKSSVDIIREYVDCLMRYRDEVFGSRDYRWQDQQQQLHSALLAESDDVWVTRMVIVAQKPTSVPSDLEPNDEVPTKDLSEDPGCCFVRRALGDILSALGPAYAKHYEWITAGLNARVKIPIKWAILVGEIINSPLDARTKFFSSLASIWLLQCGILGSNSPAVHEIKGRDGKAWLAYFRMLAAPHSLGSPRSLAECSREEKLITACRLLVQDARCSVLTQSHNLRRDSRGSRLAGQENGFAADRDGLQGDEAAGGDAETEMWCHVEKADGVS